MPIPAHIQHAIQAYYAERATPDEVAALEDWFREDQANLKAFAEHGLLEWQMLCELEKRDAAAVVSILREAEEQAEPAVSLGHTPALERKTGSASKKPITHSKFACFTRDTVIASLRTKVGKASAIAAVLLLGLTLFITLSVPHNATSTVATLTAEHDAVWDVRPDSALAAGQRLNLKEGFAEITTQEGAVAILEAPAVIELIDRNAMRLHSGKLVGICETESSKGFVVLTPNMAVTDLGTRFGVDVSDIGSTETHVFSGSVSVQPAQATSDEQKQLVNAGQAVRANKGSDQLTEAPSRPDRFALPKEIVITLPSTGFGVAFGKGDPAWQIVAREGKALKTPRAAIVTSLDQGRDGLPNTPDTSQWVTWNKTRRTADSTESYLFQTRITMPENIDLASARIILRCSVDNTLAAIVVNGQRFAVESSVSFEQQAHEITQGLVAGENTIGLEVINRWSEGQVDGKNSVGLRVVWELRGVPL